MKSVFVITSLSVGGAQKALLNLLNSDIGRDFPPFIITLVSTQGMTQQFQQAGFEVFDLSLNKPWLVLQRLQLLFKRLKKAELSFIHGWQHHGNIVATILWRALGKKAPLLWSIHHTPENNPSHRLQHRFILWLGKCLSKAPTISVYVSQRSLQQHIKRGYCADNASVIPNGVAIPKVEWVSTSTYRADYEIPDDRFVIGSLTRYVEEKDLPNLLQAAAILKKRGAKACLVLAGEGMEHSNTELVQQIEQLELQTMVILLGVCSHANQLIQCMDIATLSSKREAFPLFLAEAMALEKPVVATDVGDIAEFVADSGIIVPREDAQALAQAWQTMYKMSEPECEALGKQAKQIVASQYSHEQVVKRYQSLLHSIVA